MDRKGFKDFCKLCGECIIESIVYVIVVIIIGFVIYYSVLEYEAIKNLANMNTNTIEQEEQKEYYCPECGNDISEDDKFCEKCGTKLNN